MRGKGEEGSVAASTRLTGKGKKNRSPVARARQMQLTSFVKGKGKGMKRKGKA